MNPMFLRVLISGLFFVPILGKEGTGFCILAWAVILGFGVLQFRLASRGKWKWACPGLTLAILILTEILMHVVQPQTGALLLISYVYQMYMLVGTLAGWLVYGLIAWTKKSRE